MSRMINRLYGRVYGWFDSKDARSATKPLPARFRNSRSQLAITNLEDRVVPATTFVVNLATDIGGAAGVPNGTVGGFLAGDLRYCIDQANITAGADTIVFNTDPAFGIDFDAGLTAIFLNSTLTANSAASQGITITGPGADKLLISRNGAAAFRAFTLQGPNAFTITDLTISGLSNSLTAGGTIGFNAGTPTAAASSLTLNRVNISGNTSSTAALYLANGKHSILNSTISGNSSGSTTGGGAIRFLGSDTANTLTVENSTLSFNTTAGSGGGINATTFAGTINIRNSTIIGNKAATATTTAGSGGGAISRTTTTAAVINISSSIIAGNSATGANVVDISLAGTLVTGANTDNVIGVMTKNAAVSGAVTDPRLSAQGYHRGGVTPVMVPLRTAPASLAVDLQTTGTPPGGATDQSGANRGVLPFDAGSVESTLDKPFAMIPILPNIFTGGGTAYPFDVYLHDDTGIDTATIDDDDEFQITGPNGFSTFATYVPGSYDPGTGKASYTFNTPGGTWEGSDNGFYTITLVANQIKNTNGVATSLVNEFEGAFLVLLPQPTAAYVGNAGFTSSPQSALTFTVRYTDIAGGAGIDYDTLTNSDIRVTGAGFPANTFATFVSSNLGTNVDGTPLTATYSIVGPGGSFDAAEDGQTVTLALEPLQVANTLGTSAPAGTLGSFVVGFPQTITVDTDTDVVDGGDGLISLREAIIAANASPDSADTIRFNTDEIAGKVNFSSARTINLVGSVLPTIAGSVTIISQGAAVTITKPTTFSGNLLNIDRASVVSTVNLTNLLLQGTTTFGAFAGLNVADETVTLTNVTITGVTGTGSGAGISGTNPTLTLTNSAINANSTSSTGAGISLGTAGATLTLTNTTINGNLSSSTSGGGVRVVGGTVTVTGSAITNNVASSASALGGGFSIGAGSLVTIDNTTIDGNSSGGSGGGISMNTGAGQGLYITNSTISRNTANSSTTTSGGGGILFGGTAGHAASGKGVLIRNTTIAGNSAAQSGGGLLLNNGLAGTIDIQNSTIVNNTAAASSTVAGIGAGGISVAAVSATVAATVNILSTIISGNTNTNAANTFDDGAFASSTFITINSDFSAITDQDDYIGNGGSGTFSFGSENLAAVDATYAALKLTTPSGLAPFGLALNGNQSGFITKTVALGAGSTAKDQGSNPTTPTIALTLDQTGNPRVYVPPSPPAGAIDIGSFERIPGAPTAAIASLPGVHDNVTPLQNPYRFTVAYSDDSAILLSSITNPGTDITVTKAGGGSPINATFVEIVGGPMGNQPIISAVYEFAVPGGGWDFSDNGAYEIRILTNAVSNTDSVAVPAGLINTLTVAVGKEYTVTTDVDDVLVAGSLRNIIAAANTNGAGTYDTVKFDPAFFGGAAVTLTLTKGEIAITDGLTIDASNMANGVTISGNSASRIFNISGTGQNNSPQTTVTFNNLDLTKATSTTRGGAVFGDNEIITFIDSSITSTTTTSNGAAVGTTGGTGTVLTLTRTVVSGNKAAVGGAFDTGGSPSTLNITDSTISGNVSTGVGGAISAGFVTLNLTGSTLSGNSAATSGGAIHFPNGATIAIANSTISGNTHSGAGGTLNFNASATYVVSLNIRNSTITLNNSTTTGASASGGINWNNTAAGSSVTINSTIIAGNLIASPSVTASPDLRFSATKAIVGTRNLIGVGLDTETNATFDPDNLGLASGKASPLLAKLLPLASNGGLTQTHAVLPGTPASDAGNNITPALTTDQRGAGFNRVANITPDIGSYERNNVGVPAALPDSFAPVTSALLPNLDYTFTVSYANESNLDLTTFGATLGNDVLVTGPGGYSQPGIISGAPVPTPDDKFVVVTYTIPAPAGGWTGVGAELYTVTAQGGTVKAVNTNAIATAVLGTIRVDLPTVFVVNTDLDVVDANDSLLSLREAVAGSNANTAFADVITFGGSVFSDATPDVLVLTGTELALNDAVTIDGTASAKISISGNNGRRIFNTSVGATDAVIEIKNLTLTAGSGTTGGALTIGDEAVTLTNVTISNSKATDGGAIFLLGAATLVLEGSTLSNNTSVEQGGAIFTDVAATVTINKSTLSGNTMQTTSFGGGAIYLTAGTLTVTNSTLSGNSTAGTNGGGAIYAWLTPTAVTITNSTFSNNTAPQGGAIRINSGPLTLHNTTIVGNSATASATAGGGISFISTGAITIENSIIAGNSAAGVAQDIHKGGTNVVDASYSAIGSPNGFTLSTSTKNLPYGVNLMLGTLANNGGPTLTILPSLSSPLVDRGGTTAETKDQRGSARPVGINDIGAVEAGTPPNPYAILDSAETPVDGAAASAIAVTFYDGNTGLLGTSLDDGNELIVTGPDGTQYPVSYVSGAADGSPVAVMFSMPAPGGTWGAGDGGEYTISLIAGGIASKGPPSKASDAAVLGTFVADFTATYHVTTTNDDGIGSLRRALHHSNLTTASDDTITFGGATFTDGTADIIAPLAELAITDSVIIDGNQTKNLLSISGSGARRIFNINDGVAGTAITVALQDLSLIDGTVTGSGGAVVIQDENVTFTRTTFSGNKASISGGAISVTLPNENSLTIQDSLLTLGSAGTDGGAIQSFNPTTDKTLTLTIRGSTISNNTSNDDGGGVNLGAASNTALFNLLMENSTLSGNIAGQSSATGDGGGLYFRGKVGAAGFNIRNSTISGNSAKTTGTASVNGGGLAFPNIDGTVTIQNSTITKNTSSGGVTLAGQGGGGISINRNTAATPPAATLVLESTLVAGNSAASGRTDIASQDPVLMTYSAVGVAAGFTEEVGSASNLAYGIDLKLAPSLTNNGGPTETHAVLPLSPLIGAGINNVVGQDFDQRGVGFPRQAGTGVDIGSTERIPGVPAATISVLPSVTADIAGTNNPYTFTVTYSDDTFISRATIGNQPDSDISITKDGGSPFFATFVSADQANDQPIITATYSFTPPGGSWDSVDNGTYQVSLPLDAVKNSSNVSIPPSTLGTFAVNALAPAATGTGPLVTIDSPATNPYTFTVTYSDANAIDTSSIINNNNAVRVTGPNGFDVPATYLSIDSAGNGTPRVATYQITPPVNAVAGWDTSDSGGYNIVVQGAQVKNLQSTFVPAGTVGSFMVAVGGIVVVTNTDNSGTGSLRGAIEFANSVPGSDTIIFSSLFDSPQTITLATELSISEAVTINGPGRNNISITVTGANRILNTSAAPLGATITINDVTITGATNALSGAGVLIGDEAVTFNRSVISNHKTSASAGAGIDVTSSDAFLTIRQTTVANNTSSAGGGIRFAAAGNLLVESSTFFGNATTAGNSGGAIRLIGAVGAGGFTIRNSTLANNSSGFNGGALGFTSLSGTVLIQNSTITGNTVGGTGNGGGIGTNAGTGTINLVSTIISGNVIGGTGTSADISTGGTVNASFSAIGSNTGFTLSGNTSNLPFGTSLNLGALADNGGITQTILPASTSLVLDAGSNSVPLTTDQRGFARSVGQTDIGAVEVQRSVTGFTINGGNAQRSRITTIEVTFSGSVLPSHYSALGEIQLIKAESGPGTVIQTGATGANGLIGVAQGTANSLILTFSNADLAPTGAVEYGSLADGRYRLSIPGSANTFVSNPGVPAQQIRRLFGDINGDGTVDGATDFAQFGGVFGTTPGLGTAFDFNQDGTIDGTTDFAQFGGRFGVTI